MKKIKTSILVWLCVLTTLAVGSVWGKPVELKYPPLGKIAIPKIEKVVLNNGLQVYLLEDHTLPVVDVNVVINNCGGYLEPPNKIGLAKMMVEVMRSGGIQGMTGDQIDGELEAVGASIETSVNSVSTSAKAHFLSDYTDKIMGILAGILRNPVFDEDKIELARTNQNGDISRRNDSPFDIIIREYRKLLCGADSPYARYPEYATIAAVSRDDMIMFHQTCLQPNNIQLAVIGDFKKKDMLALLQKYFGDWPKGQTQPPEPPSVNLVFNPSVNLAEKSDVTQSNVLIGHLGGVMGDPDYPATIVLNSVLGGSFGSRLTDNVRSRKGLAYTAYGSYTFRFAIPGIFYAYAATKSGSTAEAIREMIKQIKSMQTDPPTDDEMKRGKDSWLNSYVFNFEDNSEVIQRMMDYDHYGLPADYMQQLKTAVEKVTPQDVVDVAKRKLHPDGLSIVVVGKAEEFDEPLSVFGEVNNIDLTIPPPPQEGFAATDAELGLGQQMLMKSAEACGGTANFKAVKSVSISGAITIRLPQGELPGTITAVDVLPDKSISTMKAPMMGEQTEAFDGTIGWTIAQGQTKAKSAEEIVEAKQDMERNLVNVFAMADQNVYKVAGRGEAEFNGNKALRLDFLTALGAQFTLYVDPVSYLPAGLEYVGSTPMGPSKVIVLYKEFKEFSGIKLPVGRVIDLGVFSIETDESTIEINGKIDPTLFNRPQGI